MVGWVGDPATDIDLHGYADADLAGCRATARSTTGVYVALEGPDTRFPLSAVSKRQTSVSHSTPEAEIVATDHCVQKCILPALDLWDTLFDRQRVATVHEDNQAMVQICNTGKNPTMRHLNRTHKIDVKWLHERFQDSYLELKWTSTDEMRGDIFTKGFSEPDKFRHACDLIYHVDPNTFWQAPRSGDGGGSGAPQDSSKRSARGSAAAATDKEQSPLHYTVKEGEKIGLDPTLRGNAARLLEKTPLPKQARRALSGYGTCLGNTMNQSGAYIGQKTRESRELMITLNEMISKALNGRPFYWGSLQVNEDSVSETHTDRNNLGMSALMVFGDYVGGTFTMADGSCSLGRREVGKMLCFDGTKPHLSKHFSGKRYSVVAFLHSSWVNLTPDERGELEELGFEFPPPPPSPYREDDENSTVADDRDEVASLPESEDSYVPLAAAPVREPHSYEQSERILLEYCCGEDSRLGRRSSWSKGCHVVRLTKENDMSTPAGLKFALAAARGARRDGKRVDLWGSIPCTGGCPFQRLNAKRGPSTRRKIAAHRALFRLLFANYAILAGEVIKYGGTVALEWPTGCDYWRDPQVEEFVALHNLSLIHI